MDTIYLSFRTSNVGGSVASPQVLRGDGTVRPIKLTADKDLSKLGRDCYGKRVLFGVHGFNVHLGEGARAMGLLQAALAPTANEVFIGILWPGDYWVPAVNYPFEGDTAIKCGKLLAACCNQWLVGAQSISFASHSLGARLVLETIKNLNRAASESVCLTAAAINRDCLTTEYAAAARKSSAISLLASHNDAVLKIAFQVGDPISNILHDDHRFFQKALGYDGPPLEEPTRAAFPWQVPDGDDYGHGDYLPSDTDEIPPKWTRVATFMANAFRGLPQSWPPR
jgi:esterase/lipase superfamily enzyme